MEYYGIDYLRRKLSNKTTYVDKRYAYYEVNYKVRDFGIATPPKLIDYKLKLGWATKAVDSIANRLKVKEFENDAFNIYEIYKMNNADILFDSAILGALISGCTFVYVTQDEDGYPRLQVIDGRNATGILDPITYFLKEGYAVLERDDNDRPILEAYFTSEETVLYQNGEAVEVFDNQTNYPLLVPVINRPDAKKPFGHPVITNSGMKLIQGACRTITRSEINAEFNSTPQKYMVGVSEDLDIEAWNAQVSSFLMITKDEDGDHPQIGQFNQTSMAPFVEQMNMFVRLFAGEVNMAPDDLGLVSSNPTSAEAIKASHEGMRLYCRTCQNNFATGFLNAGLLAASLRDGVNYQRNKLYATNIVWLPIFEPDSAMLSSIGDGAIKINQAIPGYFGAENLSKLTGIESETE